MHVRFEWSSWILSQCAQEQKAQVSESTARDWYGEGKGQTELLNNLENCMELLP